MRRWQQWSMTSIGVVLLGCQESRPSFLINGTDAPIRVTYIMPRADIGDGQLRRCRISDNMPRIAGERAEATRWRYLGWKPPESTFDEERCEISFTLPAGYSAHIDDLAACSDYEEELEEDPDWRPSTSYLRILSGGREFAWWSFDVPKQFVRARRGSACIFEFKGPGQAGGAS